MTRKASRALVGASIVVGLTPTLATAAPTSPPALELPTHARYGAVDVPTNLAVAMGLNCNFARGGMVCYQTQSEALTALEITPAVIAAAGCVPAMTLYDGIFSGASVNIVDQGVWINLSTRSFDNRTSSWMSGCAGGYLASGTGGAGTRVGLPAGDSNGSLGTFNNVASSVRRCPC